MLPSASARAPAVLSSRWVRLIARSVIGLGILVAVVAHVGSEPFLHGLFSIDLRVIAVGFALAFVATVAAAWRWSVIAKRLGVGLRFPEAVALYYRSQFVNSVLPGGVIGDLQRAVTQGRSVGNVARAARAVVIERSAGQVVQITLAVIVLAWSGLELGGFLLPVLAVSFAVLVLPALAIVAVSARARRAVRWELGELRVGIGSPGALVRVVVASTVVVGCHVAILGVAVVAVGASVPPLHLTALALVILIAGSIPLNIGGWGPREGVAGWIFAIAGLNASTGVAASALFGVLAMIAVAPGLLVAVMYALRRARTPAPAPAVVLASAHRGVES
ncbi:lysylphosphatidylglycerol synthase transmembrane domain-containing protein [Agromyces sp. Marseille-P2726]|uniref:lysylphosphatidylglycerol synthase transmembrane domain-containing protein n=1 Tax=Agromyces sp. Marseille-P2726 TaxID=2709132 RepID=UPI001C2D23A9|nr:lysylphosphatidylglycerol synthase transmembrane domain-containing protein [Agromyces sp. Marseille-P2726]